MSSNITALQALRQEADTLHQTYAAAEQRHEQLLKQWQADGDAVLLNAAPREKLDFFIYRLPYDIWHSHKLVTNHELRKGLRNEAEAANNGIIPYFDNLENFAAALAKTTDRLLQFFLVLNMYIRNNHCLPRLDTKSVVVQHPELVTYIKQVNKTGIFGEADITY